jgi:hypothetical protein
VPSVHGDQDQLEGAGVAAALHVAGVGLGGGAEHRPVNGDPGEVGRVGHRALVARDGVAHDDLREIAGEWPAKGAILVPVPS